MGFSVEYIPIITSSLLVAYSLFRLAVTCFKKGKQSPFKYWSRFVFRILFFVHCIVHFLSSFTTLSEFSEAQYFSRVLLCISLAFLAASLQDFICYSNRDPTFIKRHWIMLCIPFEVLFIECQYMNYYSNKETDVHVLRISSIIFEFAFFVFVVSLVALPALGALYEIKKNDFSKSLSTKNIIATCFFGFEILCLFASCLFELSSIESWFSFDRQVYLALKASRDPVIMMICFTQDMIDWMLRWLYLDEDVINQDDGDKPDHPAPLDIELVSSEL